MSKENQWRLVLFKSFLNVERRKCMKFWVRNQRFYDVHGSFLSEWEWILITRRGLYIRPCLAWQQNFRLRKTKCESKTLLQNTVWGEKKNVRGTYRYYHKRKENRCRNAHHVENVHVMSRCGVSRCKSCKAFGGLPVAVDVQLCDAWEWSDVVLPVIIYLWKTSLMDWKWHRFFGIMITFGAVFAPLSNLPHTMYTHSSQHTSRLVIPVRTIRVVGCTTKAHAHHVVNKDKETHAATLRVMSSSRGFVQFRRYVHTHRNQRDCVAHMRKECEQKSGGQWVL